MVLMHANHCVLLIGAVVWVLFLLVFFGCFVGLVGVFLFVCVGVWCVWLFSSRKSEPLSCRGFDGYLVFIYAHN